MSSERLDLILSKISKDLVVDINNVQKCETIAQEIKSFYLEGVEPFLKTHKRVLRIDLDREKRKDDEAIKELFRGAEYYSKKAKEYFGFFGIQLEGTPKCQEFKIPEMDKEQLLYFLYSSVQLLYVVLWEVFSDFLEPLERLYYLRLCHSGVFPKHYAVFPASEDIEKMELDFVYDVLRRGTLFRVSESLPYELRLMCQGPDYFKECFSEASKEIKVEKPEDFVDDFIRLFIVRNHVCHIAKGLVMQEIADDKMQNLLYRLSTHLPKIQNSCIGIVSLFKALAGKEPGTRNEN
jgi:hypothetical protein